MTEHDARGSAPGRRGVNLGSGARAISGSRGGDLFHSTRERWDAGDSASRRAFLGWLFAFPTFARVTAAAGARLPREDLLVYRRPSGGLRRVRTLDQWRHRKAEILRGFQAVAGPLPGPEPPSPLDLKVEEETDCGGFIRRRISYASGPKARVPAYLLVPSAAARGGNRCPGVLCLHQTREAGPRLVVGLGDSPDDEYGIDLVRRGFVCLAPPYPSLGGYDPDLVGLGYVSGTLKAVWDNRRGLDLLDSLPFVQPGHYAAIGHSLGGHNAIFTSVCDERIRVVAASCAFDSFVDYMNGDITGWTQPRYMPRLRAYLGHPAAIPFDFHELIGALAPRALFVSAPLRDSNFHWRSVDRIAAAARRVYALYGAADRMVVRHPDCVHRFPLEMRNEAYAFIEKHLRDRR